MAKVLEFDGCVYTELDLPTFSVDSIMQYLGSSIDNYKQDADDEGESDIVVVSYSHLTVVMLFNSDGEMCSYTGLRQEFVGDPTFHLNSTDVSL